MSLTPRVWMKDDERAVPARDGPTRCRLGSAGLAVRGVVVAARAELHQLEPVGIVAPVLLGDVVPLLAHGARHRDLRADVGCLGHGASSCRERWSNALVLRSVGSGGGSRTRDTTIMSRVL